MRTVHPKIEALRKMVGDSPIHRFSSSVPFEATRAPKVEDNSRLIKMYFCIFGVPDDFGTVPVKGCFAKSLEERGPGSKSNYKIVVLWQHDQKDPLCIPTVLKEDEVGLYGEFEPDAVPSGDRCVLQVRSKTINQGSYGFNYVWDKMDYDDNSGLILMRECALYEVSPVTIGSQKETFAVRSADGTFTDEFLAEETEDFIKSAVPRKHHLEVRSLIDRHIALAALRAGSQIGKPLEEVKPKKDKIDLNYLTNNFKL